MLSKDAGAVTDDVTEHLTHLRSALAELAPTLAARLMHAASTEDLATLEEALGCALPPGLRSFYGNTDGDGDAIEGEERIHGLLLGAADCPDWIRAMRWLSAKEAARQLSDYRDTMGATFQRSWVPVATDDNGNAVVLDVDSGALFALDHEDPCMKDDNRIAASLPAFVEALADDLKSGALRCDHNGFYRVIAPHAAPTQPAALLLSLLEERNLIELAPSAQRQDAVAAIDAILAGRGNSAALAQKLAGLLDAATWVDETYASEDVLEVLVEEYR